MNIRTLLTALALGLFTLTPAAQAAQIQWLGHAAFKITSNDGRVILVDPFITKNPKTPEAMKDLSKLGKVDLILVTHGHGDHIGDTKAIAQATGAKVAVNADMGRTFVHLGWLEMKQLLRFNKSGPEQPIGPGVTITMVRAEHSSDVNAKDPITGKQRLFSGGEPAGYIIELEDGRKIYHAGDTGVFGDMKLIGEYYQPDLSLLPIGGRFTMDPDHAAYAIKELLRVEAVVPMHFGTFPPLTGTPEALMKALGSHPVDIIVMKPGETRDF